MVLKKINNDPNDNWTNYKVYVVECIKTLTKTSEDLEKKIVDMQLENVTTSYELKTEVQEELKKIADVVLRIQVRLSVICSIIAVFITICVNVATHLLLNFLDK